MAIISLRAYNREIEGMIDNGQLDEAVAHCRHILATFPKHIATYRLLGKAHLEQQRISDATDIFQRVLSAIPDDFVANVGMSIIREDENNLDAAIWHMELAYESQPANVAIQDELRRLYGRRDGMQPPRVRLTRGALARMYARGGLFDQAVAELRAAITEDPNRPDLQLLLAQMLYQTSQRIDAVDTCINILKKVPLCLDANRILAISLPDAENSEVVKNSRQLVVSMDPYFAFAEPEAISSDQVAENAVTIERLDYKSGIQAAEVPEQPAWATSLGISMEKTADENIPDWLKAVEAPSAASPAEKPAPGVSPFIWDTQEVEKIITDTSVPEGEIPDWMKDAGWKPPTGEAQAPPPEVAQVEELNANEPVDETLVQADIPEWLRGIAPDGFMGAQGQQLPGEGEKLSNPWLEPHQPGPTDSIIQWLEEEKPVSVGSPQPQKENLVFPPEDEIPDWLKDIDQPQETGKPEADLAAPAGAFTAGLAAFLEEAEKPTEAEDVSGGFVAPMEPTGVTLAEEPTPLTGTELGEAQAQAIPTSEEEMPDWLKEVSTEAPTETGASAVQQPITPEIIPADQELTPQAAIRSAAEPAVEPVPAEPKTESKLPEVAAAVFAAEMLSKAVEKPSEEVSEITEHPAEAIPPQAVAAAAVVSEVAQPVLGEAVSQPPEGVPSEAAPPVEAEIVPEESGVTSEPEAFAWLKGLEEEQDTQAEQLVTPGPEGEIPPPDWVKLEMEPGTEETQPVETSPIPAVEPAQAAEEEVPDWIKGLGEEGEAVQPEVEEAPTQPVEAEVPQEEELPAWLVELEQPEAEKEAAGASEEPLEWEPEELPDWLKEITESEDAKTGEKEPELSASEIAAIATAASLVAKDETAGQEQAVLVPEEQITQAQPETAVPEEQAQPAPQLPPEGVLQPEEAIELTAPIVEMAREAPPEEAVKAEEVAAQATLADARSAINSGEPSKALGYYNNLIKQNYHLDEVIKDLQDALYRYPVDVDMWVTLADAHSQTRNLQEALNAYTRAEELVR